MVQAVVGRVASLVATELGKTEIGKLDREATQVCRVLLEQDILYTITHIGAERASQISA